MSQSEWDFLLLGEAVYLDASFDFLLLNGVVQLLVLGVGVDVSLKAGLESSFLIDKEVGVGFDIWNEVLVVAMEELFPSL